jgi:hypothetical protein
MAKTTFITKTNPSTFSLEVIEPGEPTYTLYFETELAAQLLSNVLTGNLTDSN